VSYCQLAGLKVAAANGDNGTLAILIPNAHYISNGTSAEFRLGAVTAHAASLGTCQADVLAHATP
jgi:hypothetical protein